MPIAYLDIDLMPYVDRVIAILNEYDPVTQQKIIELTAVRHAMKMGSRKDMMFVADSMHKHVRQILHQARQGMPSPEQP